VWVVSQSTLAIREGRDDRPGLRLTLELVEWTEEPPVTKRHMGYETVRRQRIPSDARAWAQRATQRARSLAVPVLRLGEDHYAVRSSSQDGYYAVVLDVDRSWLVQCLCHCTAARCHPDLPIACVHAAAVVDRLVERGELRRVGWLAYSVPAEAAQPGHGSTGTMNRAGGKR
jgi:hypothetical protein